MDNILMGLRQRFKSMENIAQDFSFLDPTIIYSWSMENLSINAIHMKMTSTKSNSFQNQRALKNIFTTLMTI